MSKFKTHSRVTLPSARIDQCVEATSYLNLTASEAVALVVAVGLAEFESTSLADLCGLTADKSGEQS